MSIKENLRLVRQYKPQLSKTKIILNTGITSSNKAASITKICYNHEAERLDYAYYNIKEVIKQLVEMLSDDASSQQIIVGLLNSIKPYDIFQISVNSSYFEDNLLAFVNNNFPNKQHLVIFESVPKLADIEKALQNPSNANQVLTPTGWKAVSEIAPGDTLIGKDGLPYKVSVI